MPPSTPANKALALIGWAISAAVGVFLLHSAATKFLRTPSALAEFEHLGYADPVILPIAIAQTLGILLYLIPRTGMLGAALTTAYMGGGTAVHLRADDGVVLPIATAVLAWTGLVLRDPLVRSVMPWRTRCASPVSSETPARPSVPNHRSIEP